MLEFFQREEGGNGYFMACAARDEDGFEVEGEEDRMWVIDSKVDSWEMIEVILAALSEKSKTAPE